MKVEEGGSTFDIELTPAARLHVTVYDPDGAPFTGRLYFGITPTVKGEGTRVGTSLTADEDGRAVYSQIVPGEYVLRFKADGIGETKVPVKIPPGGATVDVRLQKPD